MLKARSVAAVVLILLGLAAFPACAQLVDLEGSAARGFTQKWINPDTGKVKWVLSGQQAESSAETLLLSQPRLDLLDDDGTTNLIVTTVRCVYNERLNIVWSADELQARSEAGGFSLQGEGFLFDLDNQELTVSNRVHAVVGRSLLDASQPADTAVRNGSSRAAGQTSTNEPLHIFSDQLRYQTNRAVFEGNVRAEDPQGRLAAGMATVQFSGSSNRVDRIHAAQDVVIESEEVRATGERADYFVAEDVVELFGSPSWKVETFEGRADEVSFNRGNQSFRATGNVGMTLPADSFGAGGIPLQGDPPSPGTVAGERAPVKVQTDDFTFRRDEANTNLNLAVCLGRVLVNDGDQSLSCRQLTISSSADSRQTESIIAEGQVVMARGEDRVTGERAVYTGADESVRIAGPPEWQIGPSRGTAELLSIDLKSQTYRATNRVRTQLPPGSLASAWSAADTGVGNPTPDRPDTERTVEISSDELEFAPVPPADGMNRATYRGNVVVSDPGRFLLRCGLLIGEIPSGTDRMDRVIADEDVEITIMEPGVERRGRGERAIYTAATGIVELGGAGGIEMEVVDADGVSRGRGVEGIYRIERQILELNGDARIETPRGRFWGDQIVLNRAETSIQAAGNWRILLDPKTLRNLSPSAPDP